MILTNYHTHTHFCDGLEAPEVMVQEAIAKGFSVLGFSGHTVHPFASDWHIPLDKLPDYVAEINRLKEKYQGQIEILCGFEADYLPPLSGPAQGPYRDLGADYLIGSTHYLITSTGCFTVDDSAKNVAAGIAAHFNGDGKKTVQAYFVAQREMIAKGGFEILGHADVIRRRNGELNFFDEEAQWYKDEIEETAKVIAASGVIVEINTGGMARKNTTTPYPSPYFLSLLAKAGAPVTINSDVHNGGYMDYAFAEARQAAWDAGYREITYLTKVEGKLTRKTTALEL
ncbi:MAG: histidinol-phosphatase [Spirochaetaceae bacterium]|nr:histidinol-phosphatase [Spirochaetaceae bacterium]